MEKINTALTNVMQSKWLSRKRLLIAFLLIVLLLLFVLIGLIIYNQLHEKAIGDRPLVLIHAPEKSDFIQSGIDVIVHATARSVNGIARMELWVNDALVATQDTPEEELLSVAVLNSNWLPIAPGPHTLVVRAVSVSGVHGQATLIVHAVEGPAAEDVDEGDTLAAAGPGAAGSDEEAGAVPDSGDSPPSLGDAPPGSGADLLDVVDRHVIGMAVDALHPGMAGDHVAAVFADQPVDLRARRRPDVAHIHDEAALQHRRDDLPANVGQAAGRVLIILIPAPRIERMQRPFGIRKCALRDDVRIVVIQPDHRDAARLELGILLNRQEERTLELC